MSTQDPALLYRRYRPMVHRRVLRFFEPQEAEEVVQEVFVNIEDGLVPAELDPGAQFRIEGRITNVDAQTPFPVLDSALECEPAQPQDQVSSSSSRTE